MKTLIQERIGEWALDEGPSEWTGGEEREVSRQFSKVEKYKKKEVRRKPEAPGWMRLRMGVCRGEGPGRKRRPLLPGLMRSLPPRILEAVSVPDAGRGRRRILSAGAVLALVLGALSAGCASTPLAAFPATHPASPEAPEAAIARQRHDLSVDQPTRSTRDLLKKAEVQDNPVQHGPAHND